MIEMQRHSWTTNAAQPPAISFSAAIRVRVHQDEFKLAVVCQPLAASVCCATTFLIAAVAAILQWTSVAHGLTL